MLYVILNSPTLKTSIQLSSRHGDFPIFTRIPGFLWTKARLVPLLWYLLDGVRGVVPGGDLRGFAVQRNDGARWYVSL